MDSKIQLDDGVVVARTRIIGTRTFVYSAWIKAKPFGKARTMTSHEGVRYGRIGSDPDSSLFEDLDVGPERTAACNEAYARRYSLAYESILRAYPHLSDLNLDKSRSMGEITTHGEQK